MTQPRRHRSNLRQLFATVVCLGISISSGHGSPLPEAFSSYDKRGGSVSKQLDEFGKQIKYTDRLPRSITIVTDALVTDPVEPPGGLSGSPPLYPSHSYIVFSSTSIDPALRVELVRPTGPDTGPLPLALAVTEYASIDPADEPQLAASPPPDGSPFRPPERVVHRLRDGSLLTNAEIFSPSAVASGATAASASRPGRGLLQKPGQPLLANIWIHAAELYDRPPAPNDPSKPTGRAKFGLGSSHDLIAHFLALPSFSRLPTKTTNKFSQAVWNTIVPGVLWAHATAKLRNNALADSTGGEAVEDLYYEVQGPSTGTLDLTTTGVKAVSWDRMKFEIDRSLDVWGTKEAANRDTVMLSRDPRLTSGGMVSNGWTGQLSMQQNGSGG